MFDVGILQVDKIDCVCLMWGFCKLTRLIVCVFDVGILQVDKIDCVCV